MITVLIHKGEAGGREHLSFDNPDVARYNYFIP